MGIHSRGFILVDYRPEHEVHNLFEVLELRVRQQASQLDNFRQYYESAALTWCTQMRAGLTFAEAAKVVIDGG